MVHFLLLRWRREDPEKPARFRKDDGINIGSVILCVGKKHTLQRIVINNERRGGIGLKQIHRSAMVARVQLDDL